MDDASRKARRLIEATCHMTIATADASGKPWSSPLFFVHDDAFTFFWVSYSGALHSANIRIRPQVAITILGRPPDHEGDGVYVDAEAAELNDVGEVERAIRVLRKRPQDKKFMVSSTADVLGDAAWRIYKAIPKTVYKRSDAGSMIEGQCITIKVGVTLPGSPAGKRTG
jgi:hypothetical protein